MIFNVTGGGGAALNFKVLAYATEAELLAATPVENTIGIITQTPITSYVFSATEPSPAAAGMVWISTGTSSTIEFNALKKNAIQVYPLSASQYVNGAWASVTAMSYQGGEWRTWWAPPVVYDYGDENLAVLGNDGFRIRSGGAGTVERYDTYFTVMSPSTSSVAMATHDDTIDVTNCKKLMAIVQNRDPGNFSFYGVGVIAPDKETDGTDAFIAVAKVTTTGEQTLTVDLSNVTGEVKIGIIALNYYMPVYKVWFE